MTARGHSLNQGFDRSSATGKKALTLTGVKLSTTDPSEADNLIRVVGERVSKYVQRLNEVFGLAGLPSPENKNAAFQDVVHRAGLTEQDRDELTEGIREFAGGLAAFTTKDPPESLEPFSMTFDNPEVGEVFTRGVFALLTEMSATETASHARRGALILMSAAFETLVADISVALLKDHPEKILAATISVRQIEELGSVDAAREYAISRAVESLMHGGISDWLKWYESFDIRWRDIAVDWWVFREIDARRNLVAHADSRVNSIYLKTARENDFKGELPDLGEEIPVSIEYLDAAKQQLIAFGVLLGASTLMVRRPDDLASIYSWAAGQADLLLEASDLNAAEIITARLLGVSRGRLERTLDLRLRQTWWTARKLQYGLERVRAEISGFDYSGLDLRHSHLRAVLLEEDERACAEIRELVNRGDISKARVRLSRYYADLIRRVGDDWLGGFAEGDDR